MSYTDWQVKGPEFAACNCHWGCPCQFNSLPDKGHCRALVGMHIEKGHFGNVRLDGLNWVGAFAWPGPIHEGNGEVQAYIDERADNAQREALLTILSGQQSEPGANMFQVFSSMITRMHEPQFVPIRCEIDVAARRGHLSVDGVFDSIGEPIRNPLTGQELAARLVLPNGFEFKEAEFASSTFHCNGAVKLASSNSHAHFAQINLGPYGHLS